LIKHKYTSPFITSLYPIFNELPSRREISEASGQKWRGMGGGNFCPQAEAKPRRPTLESAKAKQKNFLFLLE